LKGTIIKRFFLSFFQDVRSAVTAFSLSFLIFFTAKKFILEKFFFVVELEQLFVFVLFLIMSFKWIILGSFYS